MAMSDYARQPCGVGIHRCLQDNERDHVICLLRVIERLPIISEVATLDVETLRRQLEGIHRNHIELARMATSFLSPATEGSNHEAEGQQHH